MRKTCLGRGDGSGSRDARRGAGTRARSLAAVAVLVLVTASLAALACGCSGDTAATPAASASPPAQPRSGGTLNYPLLVDVNTMLPFAQIHAWEPAHQVYEGLVAWEIEQNGQVATVPCLAESWEASPDATVWTFRLRRGVRFQQPVAREVTAADVVADFRFTVRASNHAWSAYMAAIIAGTDDADGTVPEGEMDRLGVEALDRYTVRFTLKKPFAGFPDTLGGQYGWVWPADYLRRVGRRGFEERPVGTGPFVVSRRVPGSYVDLIRNPHWWNAASGQPYLEGVHFVQFSSPTERLQAFQQGRIDYTWVPQGQVAASRSLPQVQSGEWVPVVLPVEATGYVGFDMTDPVTGGAAGLMLRRAIDAAIDRRALVKAVSDGVYVPQTGLVPPVFPGWQDEQPAQPYDPAKARELYAQAGSPPLRLALTRDRVAVATAHYVQRACAAAGIDLRLQQIAWGRYVELFETGRMPPMYLFGWIADYPSPDNFLYELYLGSLSPYTSGTAYSDPDVDRLLTLARSTADPQKHFDLNRRAAHEILADKPVLPLFQNADYRLVSSRIGGFSVSPTYGVDAWKVWVK